MDFEKIDCMAGCRKNLATDKPEDYKNCMDVCNGLRKPCPDTFVDCTYRGGYFERDYCKQTCKLPHVGSPAFGLSVEQNCNTACKARTLRQSFKDPADQYEWFKGCNNECITNQKTERVCSEFYVNCKDLGGYDPADKCNQTCVKKKSNNEYI